MARRRNQRDTTKFQDVFDWVLVDQCQLTGAAIRDNYFDTLLKAMKTATGSSLLEGVWGGKSDL
jgi:hypothetical protein